MTKRYNALPLCLHIPKNGLQNQTTHVQKNVVNKGISIEIHFLEVLCLTEIIETTNGKVTHQFSFFQFHSESLRPVRVINYC